MRLDPRQWIALSIALLLCLSLPLPLTGAGPEPSSAGRERSTLDLGLRRQWVVEQLLMGLGALALGGLAVFLLRSKAGS